MKTELKIINQKEQVTIDSREVAEMLEKEHSYLLEMIQGRKGKLGIIPVLENAKLAVSDYFIESTYKVEGNNKNYTCYLVTKMGCEMLGNKLQGEKGILFSAKYVKKFNEMEQLIKQDNQFKLPQNYKEALLQLVEQVEQNEKLQLQVGQLKNENMILISDNLQWADTAVINALIRKYGATIGDFSKAWNNFKKELLYHYSICLNSRIIAYLNKTGKRTKPKTLDMLIGKEELTKALKIAIALCKEENVEVYEILGKHLKDINIE